MMPYCSECGMFITMWTGKPDSRLLCLNCDVGMGWFRPIADECVKSPVRVEMERDEERENPVVKAIKVGAVITFILLVILNIIVWFSNHSERLHTR